MSSCTCGLTPLPDEAVEAAARQLAEHAGFGFDAEFYRADATAALEAAAPHMLAGAVAAARTNNDHIVEGGDGYSAGFHYALHCVEGDAK